MNYKLEVIAFSLDSCLLIEKAGAHRIELCDNPGEGGTTPSYGFIKKARALTSIDLYCMIRPRGGDFLYSIDEFESMKTDVQLCKDAGCDGVVFGLLNADGTDDKEHDINQVMFTIDLRASFFDKGKVFNQRHSACLLHGDAIRSQTICLFKFH